MLRAHPTTLRMRGFLELLHAEIAEAVGLSFFSVVLDPDCAGSIRIVVDLGGDHSIDLDLEVIALTGDSVGVPVTTFKGVARSLAEGSFAFLIATLRTDEPLATSFVIKPAGPVPWRAVDFGLITEDLVGFNIGPKHHSAVCGAVGKKNVHFEDKVRIALFGDEEKFAIASEMNLAVSNFDRTPIVGILPALGGFPVEKRSPLFLRGRRIVLGSLLLVAVCEEESSDGKWEKKNFHK